LVGPNIIKGEKKGADAKSYAEIAAYLANKGS
jgi:hypothetical protein